MRVLVSAASKHGATTDIAQVVAEALTEAGLEAVVIPPEKVETLDRFDAAVIGSAVYYGRWLAPAVQLIERNRDALAVLPVWLFSSGPVGDPAKPEGDPIDVAELREKIGARGHRVFSGRVEKRRLGLAEKAVVAAVRAAEGDFRSWDEIREWAAGIAAELTAVSPLSAAR